MSYTDPFENDDPYYQKPGYPTTRNATRPAWRRLRKAIGPGEAADIATDIVAYIDADGVIFGPDSADVQRSIRDALVSYPWDLKDQQ